jgi:hypothetical protein
MNNISSGAVSCIYWHRTIAIPVTLVKRYPPILPALILLSFLDIILVSCLDIESLVLDVCLAGPPGEGRRDSTRVVTQVVEVLALGDAVGGFGFSRAVLPRGHCE